MQFPQHGSSLQKMKTFSQLPMRRRKKHKSMQRLKTFSTFEEYCKANLVLLYGNNAALYRHRTDIGGISRCKDNSEGPMYGHFEKFQDILLSKEGYDFITEDVYLSNVDSIFWSDEIIGIAVEGLGVFKGLQIFSFRMFYMYWVPLRHLFVV